MTNHIDPEMLTPAEVALRLKVSERTVLRLVGVTIPARKVLGKIRFYWPEVVASLPAAAVPAALDVPSGHGEQTVDLVARLKHQVKASKGY